MTHNERLNNAILDVETSVLSDCKIHALCEDINCGEVVRKAVRGAFNVRA